MKYSAFILTVAAATFAAGCVTNPITEPLPVNGRRSGRATEKKW